MIDGLRIFPLRQIIDDRGKIMLMLRKDQDHFDKFGEIYFSFVHPDKVKAWHYHKEMTLNYSVIQGKIKLVLFDDRDDSPTRNEIQEIYMGPEDYKLVQIPPRVWNGFIGCGQSDSIVANCTDIPSSSDEILRHPPFTQEIPYKWFK